jgi:hypothetical protein
MQQHSLFAHEAFQIALKVMIANQRKTVHSTLQKINFVILTISKYKTYLYSPHDSAERKSQTIFGHAHFNITQPHKKVQQGPPNQPLPSDKFVIFTAAPVAECIISPNSQTHRQPTVAQLSICEPN